MFYASLYPEALIHALHRVSAALDSLPVHFGPRRFVAADPRTGRVPSKLPEKSDLQLDPEYFKLKLAEPSQVTILYATLLFRLECAVDGVGFVIGCSSEGYLPDYHEVEVVQALLADCLADVDSPRAKTRVRVDVQSCACCIQSVFVSLECACLLCRFIGRVWQVGVEMF